MPHPKPLIVGAAITTVALAAALAFERVYHVTIRVRPGKLVMSTTNNAAIGTASPEPPFTLRLVDSGGVGIPLADWGRDYSHDRRVFRDVILEDPPFVDPEAFHRIETDWRSYVERMLEYGNNAIAVPLFLELIDFDRLRPSEQFPADARVYDAESPFRARHAAMRRHFGRLFEWTAERGMEVFLDTDMLALTPPLSRELRRLAPNVSASGVDTSNPAVWEIYRAGLEELFDELPSLEGVVIRFGEGGSLYNTAGWPYRSEMAVRSAASLRAMLRGLLPVFEARQKTLVLRSWTVGVGQVGRLHVDPRIYDAVLGDIDSPALIVSTKFTAGDFFSYLPLNPTLAVGRHRRIIELQAKPEFEGFGAFPNFLGEEHARALRALHAANPRIVGTYVLPQFGGPLRSGPRLLYPFHGFWLWTDANVFVASRLAADPAADVRQLARTWAEGRFGTDARIVDAVTNVLILTREAVLDGFYIRPFAEREVRVPGLELPPLMWIFEWDMVGGWHSLLSIVYHGTRDSIDVAIQEGDAAVGLVRRAREQLQAAFTTAGPRSCTQTCDEALRSLEYQETLFEALAAWRQAFLSYYRWLDTGDAKAWTMWRVGRKRFDAAAAQHVARFGDDANFPAFDLTSASRAVTAADRAAWARWLGGGILIAMLAVLGIGCLQPRWAALRRLGALSTFCRVIWTSAITPWRLGSAPLEPRPSLAVAIVALTLIGFVAGALTGFTTPWIGVGAPLICGVVAIVFQSTATRTTGDRWQGRLIVASIAPLIPGAMVLIAFIAYFGPIGVWYSFWVEPLFRVVLLTLVLAMALWIAYAMLAARALEGWRGRIGGAVAAAGAGLVTLTALLPGWVDVLRFLDRPLNVAPATDTMLFALRTYAGVSLDIGRTSLVLGTLLLAGGYAMCTIGEPRRGHVARPDPASLG